MNFAPISIISSLELSIVTVVVYSLIIKIVGEKQITF